MEYAIKIVYMLNPERAAILGQGKTYVKKGNTAICLFDSFSGIDKKAWADFYSGKGPRPTVETSPKDPMAIFLDALEQAANDPEVKNFVIDLTLNGGGSSDVVVAMTSLMYNQSFVRAQNLVTGQNTTWYYDVDRNFDGKFDAQDQLVHYNLNFCVLTSFRSFSCGNLFPALCKEAGVFIAGEKSGGGSCGVGVYRTPEGISYHISTAHGRLADENWQNIDGGITPHTIIPLGDNLSYEAWGVTYTLPSHAKFYDLDYLNKIINDYYQK
jgi:C-terminal processing protease CtpA/Prc